MTAFNDIPILAQNFTAFWALLLCLCAIAGTIMLFRQKRYQLAIITILCLFGAYFVMHVCRDGTIQRLGARGNALAIYCLNLPCIALPTACLLMTILCAWMYRNITIWKKTHITASSIKESMDMLPAGICYYLEDGRCILSNHRMNDICFSLLGHALQNGAQFYDSVCTKPVHLLSDGTAVSFHHRELTYRGALLHELIANNITDLNEKSEQLKANNERLRKLAENMKAYSETITDTVRQKEILQAKINIHDEMNRMILTTQKSLLDAPDPERHDILRSWKQVLLLCKEADGHKTNSVIADLNTLAAAIGIRLVWTDVPTNMSPAMQTLFLAATREAMTNAIKHAQAKTLDISINETSTSLQVKFTNDGKSPNHPVMPHGGLLNLCRRLESVGGRMTIETEPVFCLDVVIPKKCHAT
jgi:hypothetical protein